MSEITLQEAVKKFAADLAGRMNNLVADMSELEVYTFTTPSDQVEVAVKDQASFSNLSTEAKAALRAYTKISFDGDMVVWVPMNTTGEVDKSVWELHQVMVQQAMANRKGMLQSVSQAAASTLKALGAASGK